MLKTNISFLALEPEKMECDNNGTSEISSCEISLKNADHVLNCTLHQEDQTRHWPHNTTIEEKLHGELPDLENNEQLISNAGLVI